jgi:NAD(P)-dependent dehydrogenase (short-subunit alcohol dehydrogenase family)
MRAVKRVCAKDGIAINCVAPWMTDTRLIYPALSKTLAEASIPVQYTEAVALAMGYSVAREGWMGKTIYVAAGTYTEIKEPILQLEKGVESAAMFRRGRS